MKPETINKLCCSFDKSELELTTITSDINGNILQGFLTCGECQRIYPIIQGIPVMSPDEYREFHLEQPLLDRWKRHLKGRTYKNFRLVAPATGERGQEAED
jgi:uncharacterized protein